MTLGGIIFVIVLIGGLVILRIYTEPTPEEKEQLRKIEEEQEQKRREELQIAEYHNDLLDRYSMIVQTLYKDGTLYVIQDYLVGNLEDTYDLTSYKLELVAPVYDGRGRIMRNGQLYTQEYVLYVAYSICTKDKKEETKTSLIHVFNGNNGGYAYTENDEKGIYQNMINDLAEKSGKNMIEEYSQIIDPNTTNELINRAEAGLIEQLQEEQTKQIVSNVASSVMAGMLVGSAAKIGHDVKRTFGR